MLCKELDLYAGQWVAIDGSYFRGNVAKHSIYSKARLSKLLARVEHHIEPYLKELDQADAQAGSETADSTDIHAALDALKARQLALRGKLAQLNETGQTQYAKVDPDARLLSKSGQRVAGYNVQIAVDDKHKLLVCSELTQDGNDSQQLLPMASRAQAVLAVDKLTVAADAGYYNTMQINACEQAGITVFVPSGEKNGAVDTPRRYGRDQFHYDAQRNAYRCPQGQGLSERGSKQQGGKYFRRYVSRQPVCAVCPVRPHCLSAKTAYREIYRWEHEVLLDAHRPAHASRGGRTHAPTRELGGTSLRYAQARVWVVALSGAGQRKSQWRTGIINAVLQLHAPAHHSRDQRHAPRAEPAQQRDECGTVIDMRRCKILSANYSFKFIADN